ncbi:8-oxo-dGDP phosphatase NUDT18-like [Halichondria panicea]|uniref:8-oxo-dGDP phosphatase NUDT18-like n=1 Tax=Halichondria panicea TaxID=6063 RepID=UPI00312B7152
MEEIAAVVNCTPTPQPLHPDIRATDMRLRLHSNVIYLVAGVVVQDGKVLLIQECKISFKNKWYLPAGRMEPDESIVEAVQREVLEESGYQFQPEALVAVQRMDRKRVRFGLAGSIIGGSLKTKEQADGESTQAAWFTTDTQQLVKELKLRNNSILPLIEAATEWFANRPYTGLPVAVGHVSSSQRLLIVQDIGQELKVLVSRIEGGTTRLPSCLIHRDTLFSRVDHNSTLDSAVKVSLVHRACGMFIL